MPLPRKPFLRDARYERWRWQVFAITWLAYVGFYLTRKSFAVAKIALKEGTAVGLTGDQMGYIDGAYLVAYALGQFVWGMCGDRFGTRRVVSIGLFVSVLAGFMMGVTPEISRWMGPVFPIAAVFGVFSCIQGFAQSTGWAPLIKNIGQFFSQHERGMVMGLWSTNFAVGGYVASRYAGIAGEQFGYQYAFFVPAATLLAIWVLFRLLQTNRPEDVGLPSIEQYHNEPEAVLEEGETPEVEPEGSWKVIYEVITTPMVILLAAVYFFLKPTRYAILFWGPLYVNEKLGTGMAESGALAAMFELAGPVSIFLAGVISDKLLGSRRIPVCVIGLLLLSVAVFSLEKIPEGKVELGVCLFVVGFCLFGPDAMISGTASVDFGTKKGASTAGGLINGCGSVGAVVGGTIPGFFKEAWGWSGVFTFLAICSLIAGLLLIPCWNAMPKTVEQNNGLGKTEPT